MLSGALESTDGARRDPPGVPDEPQVSALDFLTRKTPVAIPVTTTAALETPPPVIPSPYVITSCNDEPLIPSQSTSDATETTTQPNPAEAESSPQPVSASVATTLPAISVSRIRAGNGKYKQRILSFARPTAGVPPATVPHFSTPRPGPSQPDAANNDKYPRVLTVEQWQHKANEKWLKHFPWLIISETSWGQPCMRCSICMVHGDPSYQYGRDGEGGLDIQRQTMRKHQHSIKHEASVDRQQLRDCKIAARKSIVDFENGDGEANRLTKLMATVFFICRSDSPIVLFVTLVLFMAEMGTHDMPLKDPGTYYSEQLVETLVIYLRAQQMKHIRESPYLDIQLDESTDRRRGKHLIVYLSFLRSNTPVTEFFAHLTVEQCDAGSLQAVLLTHLESSGLDLERISGISTDGASVMVGSQTGLVARLRARIPHLAGFHCIAHRYLLVRAFPLTLMCVWQVDVRHVLQMVDNTSLTLRNRYLSDADDSGDGSNELSAFLSKHALSEKREVKVTGTNSTGAPTTHEYTLHEQNIKGQKSGPGLDDCITLTKGYVKELLKRLESQIKDLGSLDGAKLFTQGAYPKSHSKRQRRFLQWLEALRNLFKRKPSDPDTLPGTASISVVID
ncbi:unnamed protein product [Closterium sp. NIES-53]